MSTALREVFARFGVEFDSSKLITGNAAVDGAIGRLRELGNVIGGAALVTGTAAFVEDIRRIGTEVDHTSRALGVSAQSLQTWRGVAARAGIGADQLTPSLQALRRNASAAAIAGGQMGRDFRTLGVSIRDGNGGLLSTDELLSGVLEGLAEVPDETTRAAIAMRLLGEQGARLGPLLQNGAEGVRAARTEIEALGGGLDQETIDAAAALTRETQDLDLAMLGLRGRIALFVLPALTRLVDLSTGATAAFRRMSDNGHILGTTFAIVGAAGVLAARNTLLAWASAALPFIAIGLAIAALILIVEDVWVAMEGGESVIGTLSEQFNEFVLTGEGGWHTLALGAELFLDVLTSIVQVGAQAAAGFTGLFGLAAEAAGFQDAAQGAFDVANSLGSFGERDLGTESNGTPEGDAAAALVRSRRERGAGTDILTPDAFERFSALRTVRADTLAASGPPAPTTVNIGAINANGLDEAAATRVAENAITRAMARSNDDLVDTLGGGS